MARNHLRNVVKKLQRKDTIELLGKWDKFSTADMSVSMTKMDTVRHVLDNCSEVTREEVWQLDLLHLQKHPSTKLWTAYNYRQVAETQPPEDIDTFSQTLKKEINLYFKSDVSIAEADGVFWVRIWFHEGHTKALPKTTDVTYVAYVPGTDFFFVTPVKRLYMTGVVQALMMTLDGLRPQKQELHSRQLYSLIQLKNDQGGLNSKGLTIDAVTKEQRVLKERMLEQGVEDEEEDKRKHRLHTTEKIFGPNLQPKLDKLEFKLVTPFKPCPVVPLPLDTFPPDESFNCQVTFTGSNVIEGIRKLAEVGLADLPLPTHLCQLHTRGISKITLKPKASKSAAT